MAGQNIAYKRVSAVDQNLDRQLIDHHIDKTFHEKASGKDTNRPVLQECLSYAREGDTLHVHSIDRLARDMADLLRLVRELTEKGISIHFHKEKLIFTGEDNPLQTLQLQMMGAFAQFERSMIKERQREGIAAAKAKGKQIGAKRKLTPAQVAEIKDRIGKGETKKSLAQEYAVSRQTLYSAIS